MFRLDADPQPNELLSSQTINDRPQTVLSAMRAFWPDPYHPERQRQIVRYYDQSFDRPVRLFEQTAHGLAAQVHVCLRLHELDRLIFNFRPPNQRAALFALYLRSAFFRELIYEHEPKIVPRSFVLAARIAQADDEPVSLHATLLLRAAVAFALGRSFANHLRFGAGLELRFKFRFLHDRDHRHNRLWIFVDLDTFADL